MATAEAYGRSTVATQCRRGGTTRSRSSPNLKEENGAEKVEYPFLIGERFGAIPPQGFAQLKGMIKFTYRCMQLGKIENHETSKEIPLFKSIMVSDFILFEGTDQNLLVVINESCWAPINGSIHGVTGAFFPLNRWSYGPRLITGFPGPLSGSFSWSVAAGDTDAASAPECVGGSKPC